MSNVLSIDNEGEGHGPGPASVRERAVPAVSRACAILRLLARGQGPGGAAMGVQAIARALGLVPSTCLHILRALAAEGLVDWDPASKQWRLGLGLLALSRPLLASGGFAATIQPELDRLSARFGVTAIGLTVQGLQHVVVTAISRAREPFHIHVDVGSRFPALISATGRVLGAFAGHRPAALRRHLRLVRWDDPPDWETWMREVEEARAAGFGTDRDRYIRGVTVLSAPVREAGLVTHALVVVGLTERLRGHESAAGEELVRIAGTLERRMDATLAGADGPAAGGDSKGAGAERGAGGREG